MQSSRHTAAKRNILVVEDSPLVLRILERLFRLHPELQPVFCASLGEAQVMLETSAGLFFAAVVDLHLPDATDGEIVDLVLAYELPCIVLTASYNEYRRDQLLLKGVVDYVLKDSQHAYEYAFQLLNRLESNRQIKILIAEDSHATRQYIRHVLTPQRYQLLEASDGDEALRILRQQPDIDLFLVDHSMPGISGFDLVKLLRQDLKRKELIILGLSTDAQGALSAKFIKHGADDFLRKPFCPEELNCRVLSSLERRDMLRALKQAAQYDALTGLNNRRAFYEQGQQLLTRAHANGDSLSTVMIDLDLFKRINDEFGHASGDAALVTFSRAFSDAFPEALLGRLGGEEFAMLSPQDAETLSASLDRLREHCLGANYATGAPPLSFSAGIYHSQASDLESLLHQADRCLYEAKHQGRGRNFWR
jgi:diguanylate cyclase (GGDEF)-like protein